MQILRKVISGYGTGRKIGFPTLNFNVGDFGKKHAPGVYACEVKINGKKYKGALYFGPKHASKGSVLEIHVLNFKRNIYGEFVNFEVGKKIRKPMRFKKEHEMIKQIKTDLLKM